MITPSLTESTGLLLLPSCTISTYTDRMVLDYAQTQLALLRPLWPDFDLWVVYCTRPAPDLYCARRKGEATACVNAGSPDELIKALAELEAAS